MITLILIQILAFPLRLRVFAVEVLFQLRFLGLLCHHGDLDRVIILWFTAKS